MDVDRRQVLVTLDERHRDDIGAVLRALAAAGFVVAECFPASGVVAGEVATCDIAKLRAVTGIAAVEDDPTFRCPR